MLRSDPGESRRSILSAAVALATAALTAACTGGSSSGSAHPTPGSGAPVPSTTSATPDTIGQDATASLQGSATITVGNESPVTVKTKKDQPVSVELSPSGGGSVQFAMQSSAGDLFTLDGPARAGTSSGKVHVAMLLNASGVLVDTANGNPCTTSYDAVSDSSVKGTVRCESLSGQQKVPVVVRFSAS